MERTIKVTGKGTLSVKPDFVRLLLTITGGKESYEETMKESAEQTEKLAECLCGLGLERSELRTLSFDVDSKYETYQDGSNNWKQRFIGYQYTHEMKIEFPEDKEFLGKALYALAHSEANPEFHVVYIVKNAKLAKNELLGRAVSDSKRKAKVLAKAAGVQLGEVVNIDYSWEEEELIARPMARSLRPNMLAETAEAGSYDINISPDDITITDVVTVIWAITEQKDL